MGIGDKIENAAEKLTGQAKEKVGEHRGDEDLAAEGRTDQGKADLKQAGEKIKDAFKN
ncbi:CsbD family protein [Herbiconiux sp. L3-i23]|uniref:CsbD family protein n=1 Tax=Herbiconiux sp. L3-i23 TaxID=2905871 RepID=UPI002054135C|nr:CsbD family protein [Herbiconiux sp. L3-i23]BDI22822.1 CsbD family protein [Herbiconiux sp. L3-i23]